MTIGVRLVDREAGSSHSSRITALLLDRDPERLLNTGGVSMEAAHAAMKQVFDEIPAVLDVFAPDPTCDVCRAAKLAESGVMASAVPPEQLHGQCRNPGSCACGCEMSKGGTCVNCGRTHAAGALVAGETGPECLNRTECAEAILEARTAAPSPKSSTKATGARTRAPSAPKTPRAPKAKAEPRDCTCGCGEQTAGGLYRPGHDARHVRHLVENIRGGSDTLETALAELPSDALRAKLSKQVGA